MALKRNDLDLHDLAQRYAAGTSIEVLGKMVRYDPSTLRIRLRNAGLIQVRTNAEAQIAMNKTRTPERRKEIAAAANRAALGRKVPEEEKRRCKVTRAIRLQKTGKVIGRYEKTIRKMLKERGVQTSPQYPVEGYNIDLAVLGELPVAVEISNSTFNPLTAAKTRVCIKKLTELGWAVIHIWVSPYHPLASEGIDEVVAAVNLTQRDPTSRSQYRVIRGCGDSVPRRRNSPHHWPLVGPTVDL